MSTIGCDHWKQCYASKGILTGNIQLKDTLTEQRKKPNFSIDVEKFGECLYD